MKLSVDFSLLLAAVETMGAAQINFELSNEVRPLEPIDIQLGEGLEVNLKDIKFDTGLASYQGRQVLLYIKDHGRRVAEALEEGSRGKKYHISDCCTLDDMRKKGRFDRYVVTNDLNGFFQISGQDCTSHQPMEGKAELSVCKNCLRYLNYQGYETQCKLPIFNAFKLTDFFDTYRSFFKYTPSGIADSQESGYTKDWSKISKKLRKEKNFICQQCDLDLSQTKRLLHVHHINGVKHDNSDANLRVFCADCHRKQPNHHHLFIKHTDTQLINRLRNQQKIFVKGHWKEVYALADPAMHGVINLLEEYKVPLPRVGEEIQTSNHKIRIELELTWRLKKIGIAIDKKSIQAASNQGWTVWSMRESLMGIGDLAASLR